MVSKAPNTKEFNLALSLSFVFGALETIIFLCSFKIFWFDIKDDIKTMIVLVCK